MSCSRQKPTTAAWSATSSATQSAHLGDAGIARRAIELAQQRAGRRSPRPAHVRARRSRSSRTFMLRRFARVKSSGRSALRIGRPIEPWRHSCIIEWPCDQARGDVAEPAHDTARPGQHLPSTPSPSCRKAVKRTVEDALRLCAAARRDFRLSRPHSSGHCLFRAEGRQGQDRRGDLEGHRSPGLRFKPEEGMEVDRHRPRHHLSRQVELPDRHRSRWSRPASAR